MKRILATETDGERGWEILAGNLIKEALRNVETCGGRKIGLHGWMQNIPAKPYQDAFFLLTCKDFELAIVAKGSTEDRYKEICERVRKSYGFQDLVNVIQSGSEEGQKLHGQLRLYGVHIE